MLSDFTEPFVRLYRQETDAGAPALREGERVMLALSVRRHTEVTAAGLPADREQALLLHQKSLSLRQDDLVRRVRDGAVYRVTGGDRAVPAFSGLGIAENPAERVVTA